MRLASHVPTWEPTSEEEANPRSRSQQARAARLSLAAVALLFCATAAARATKRSAALVAFAQGDVEEAADFILQRYVVLEGGHIPSRCLEYKSPNSTYNVALIFAGRKNVMSLLVAHLDALIQDCSLHEVHLWDYTHTDEDRAWLKNVSVHPGFRLMTGEPLEGLYRDWSIAYRYYTSSSVAAEPRFKPRWPLATRNTTVLTKIDDDIIYFDRSGFANFTEWVRSHPEKFLVMANVVNNGVAAYYQGLHFPLIVEEFPELKKYPFSHGTPGQEGPLLWDSYLSSNLLWLFLRHPKMFSWQDPEHDNCPMFAIPQEDLPRGLPRPAGQGRFSINFFGVRWARWDEASALVAQAKGYDEKALTIVATKQQPHFAECIYTPFTAVHFSFGSQRQPEELVNAFNILTPRPEDAPAVVQIQEE